MTAINIPELYGRDYLINFDTVNISRCLTMRIAVI